MFDEYVVPPAEQVERIRAARSRLRANPSRKAQHVMRDGVPLLPTPRGLARKPEERVSPLSYGELIRLSEPVVPEFIPPPEPYAPSARSRTIIKTVGEWYGIDGSKIVSATRRKRIAFARQVAIWLMCDLLNLSTPQIGTKFKRDHSTVIHARVKIEKLMERDERIREDLKTLRQRVVERLDSLIVTPRDVDDGDEDVQNEQARRSADNTASGSSTTA